jgi:hypothetical protein
MRQISRKRSARVALWVVSASLWVRGIGGCSTGSDDNGGSDTVLDATAQDVAAEAAPPGLESGSMFDSSPTGLSDARGNEGGDGARDVNVADVAEEPTGHSESPSFSLPIDSDVFDGSGAGLDGPSGDAANARDANVADVADAVFVDAEIVTEADLVDGADAADVDADDANADAADAAGIDGGPTTTVGVFAARGPACLTCVHGTGCLDPTNDLAVYCEQLSGADVEGCLDVLQCILNTGCNSQSAYGDPTPCFCGDASPCFDVDSTPDGPCVQQYFEAGGTTDPSQYEGQIVATGWGGGAAGVLEECIANGPTGPGCPVCE